LSVSNTFQIISGEYRGRKFNFPDAPGLRPTSSKIRETLFNWIQFESFNKTYLDLFSGSGSLSFEALSRGAKEIVSIEKNTQAFQNLEKNRKLLKSDKIQCFNQDALEFLSKKSNQTFDFVFLDPPFNKNILPKALKLLSEGGFVATGSKIYIESEYIINEADVAEKISEKIEISKQKQSGNVFYCLIELL
jgi:16S rRNA m(2)G-966 methyltransferase (EC 2.1.1.52)